jgi:peptidoglycan/xylan/chitin deacetylase (PgdA/CDA1 family)
MTSTNTAVIVSIGCVLAVSSFSARQTIPLQESSPSSRAIALTFDDLPYVDLSKNPGSAQRATAALLRMLAPHRAPVTAFVNEGKLQTGAERAESIALLQQWVDAGAILGNHTHSHADFNGLTVRQFEEEILRGEPVTRQLMQARGPHQRFFRHPYTHTGDTAEKKQAIERFLAERSYTIAPHTIDSHDFIFNAALAAVRRRADEASARRVKDAYLDFVDRSTRFTERVTREMFGREIAHTILLHANDLNAETLDELLRRFERRGYAFVSLEAAMRDSAYRTLDTYVTTAGPTWLWRWRQSLDMTVSFRDDPEPPEWVRAVASTQ